MFIRFYYVTNLLQVIPIESYLFTELLLKMWKRLQTLNNTYTKYIINIRDISKCLNEGSFYFLFSWEMVLPGSHIENPETLDG